MGKQQLGEVEYEDESGKQEQHQNKNNSLRSKAVHFVTDITTVLLNPISDKPSKQNPTHGDLNNSANGFSETEDDSKGSINEPDTSSFTAFLYSLLASSEPQSSSKLNGKVDFQEDELKSPYEPVFVKENDKKKSLFSRGRKSLGKAFYQAAKFASFRSQTPKQSSDVEVVSGINSNALEDGVILTETLNESLPLENLPETSEPSLLLSEKTRRNLYSALPVIVQGRKWILLYSTWRHGISLSSLYRKSLLCPGLSLLVIGDRKGAVFGGLVDAPLNPTNKRRYQGTNDSFVFTNTSGNTIIYRPTGINRYFTLCSTEYLAMGGGSHFALYLDGDLLNGSSSSSETYGNPCLAGTQDFEVKDVELWGFVYASKFEEMVALSRTEAPGIHNW